MMRAECIDAVQQAIGRSLKRGEAEGIEQRIRSSMTELARKDPDAWRQMTAAERLQLAADDAAIDLQAKAAKAKERVGLQIQAHDKIMNRYDRVVATGRKPFAAVGRVLDNVDAYAKGVSKEYFGRLIDTINAVDTKWLGMVEDAGSVQRFVREVMGEKTGDARAEGAAKAWLDTVESMRQRFNRAGGDVGKLDYGYLPQPHDQTRVAVAGVDKWVDDTLPLLDRKRYVNPDGTLLTDDEMRAMLGEAWKTIASGGLNKLEPGKPMGSSARANKGADHRAIHFKDPEAYFSYMNDYASGGVFNAMQGHIGRLAKDIALVEEMGPNPNAMFSFLHDTAKKTGDSDLVGPFRVQTDDMWAALSGKTGMPVNATIADIGQGLRNIEVFSKLGGATLSSVTDVPTYFAATGFNRLPFLESAHNLLRSFGKDSKEFANRGGLIADSVVSDMNRWAEANVGAGWTGKLANATMKASLLEAWTDAVRRGFGISMMGGLARMTKADWANLHPSDLRALQGKGVSEADYALWQLATPESWRGTDMLTVQSLRGIDPAVLEAKGYSESDVDRATSRLLGFIADESGFASLAPDLQAQAVVQQGSQRGTIKGEVIRSIMLFKGFPIAMITRHWGRVADTWRDGDRGMALAYGAGLTSALTLFGAIAMQMKDMAAGKDPRDSTTLKFWGAAFLQGGGVGIMGDMFYTSFGGNDRSGRPNWANLAGPVFGDVADAIDLTAGNVGEAWRGENTHAGAEVLKFTKGHLPFVNVWYARTAIDRAVLNDLQEHMSPGYNAKIKGMAKRDWGQEYWFAPGDDFSEVRPPDMGAMLGRDR
jgi:hypothetical protein